MSTVVVIGAGAIGGYVAYALSTAGHRVELGVRTPFDRLTVETQGEVRTADATVLPDPAACREAEWVVLATKAHQTSGAAGWLRAACGPDTRAVAVLQNGVEHRERAAPFVGTTPLVPVVVMCAAEVVAPGRIRHHGFSTLQLPDVAPAHAFASLFAGTGIEARIRPDFERAAWQKLLQNVTAAPITALTGRRMGVMRRTDVRELALVLARECVAVARAAGVPLTDEDAVATVEATAVVTPTMGSSMLYDRLAGRPTEVDALTGAVVRIGRRMGVAVPFNEAVLALLSAAGEPDGLPSGPGAKA